jgi:anaerobic selenocysteine-containing dehydrogenase
MEAVQPGTPMRKTHHRACHLCEAICGLVIETEGDRLVSIRGDRADPLSHGYLCPKAVALKDVHEDPDRLRRPLRRTASGFVEVAWDEAITEAALRLTDLQRAHGRNAVAVYQGNPVVHNFGALLFGQVLLRSLGSRSRFSATSLDQLPHMLASTLMFGHQLLLPVPDVDRTHFLLMLGANPLASNGSLMTAPGIGKRLLSLRERGGRLVVVDPRRTATAAMADQHVAIRPGTDALFLAALLHTLVAENRLHPGRLLAFTDGLDAVAAATAPFAPEAVAERTGVAPDVIRTLARDFSQSPAAVAYGRVGISTQEFGALCAWLVNVLNVATGNLDRVGGAMFPSPAADIVALADRLGQRGHFDKSRSRVRGLPEFAGEWPVAVLAEEIETTGPGQIKALVTHAGNPVLSAPNGARLERALRGLEYMVSIDIYLNETTRHADLILPPAFGLEQDHYDLVFHALAVRNTARYSRPVFRPRPGARRDFEVLVDLAMAIETARGGGLWPRIKRTALRRIGPRGIVAWLLRTGPHGAGFLPFARGLTLRRLLGASHGVDLGPLTPCLPARLGSRSRRISLAPPRLLDDLRRLGAPRAEPEPAAGRLLLIGRRDLRSNNSWMHNSARLVKGRDRCTLLMHPEDARARGLLGGQRVRIRSRVGSVEATLEVTEDVRPGVVSLPHGWGHGREGTRLAVANTVPGASLNDLTDDLLVDALSGTAQLTGVPVDVTG